MIDIDDCTLIAAGRHRLVFAHPYDANKILKVFRFDRSPESQWSSVWYKRLMPLTKIDSNLRDIAEHRKALRKGRKVARHICELFDLEETSKGPALVGERVHNIDGNTSLTLSDYVNKHGIANVRSAIDVLFKQLSNSHVLFRDAHARNILVKQVDKQPVLVIVDGLGEANFIPYASLSKILNGWKLHRKKLRLVKTLEGFAPDHHGNRNTEPATN
jgi:hypothetical protein